MESSTCDVYQQMYILNYLANIKEQSPLVSTRKLKYTVPMANTGVPFMPKTAKS